MLLFGNLGRLRVVVLGNSGGGDRRGDQDKAPECCGDSRRHVPRDQPNNNEVGLERPVFQGHHCASQKGVLSVTHPLQKLYRPTIAPWRMVCFNYSVRGREHRKEHPSEWSGRAPHSLFGRHYADLILRLQQEMRTELRRLAKESKTQEELVENLRDKIATQTVRVVRRTNPQDG